MCNNAECLDARERRREIRGKVEQPIHCGLAMLEYSKRSSNILYSLIINGRHIEMRCVCAIQVRMFALMVVTTEMVAV